MYKTMKNYRFFSLILFLSVVVSGYAQRAAVSTDLLKWATLSPNISADIVVASQTSINLEASFNTLNEIYGDNCAEHIMVSPELRYWFKRPLYSHYIGLNAIALIYNVTLDGSRYKGQAGGIGIGYGYSFLISKRWNLTPYIGVGYGYFNEYIDPDLSSTSEVKADFKPMLTKLGIAFTYIID